MTLVKKLDDAQTTTGARAVALKNELQDYIKTTSILNAHVDVITSRIDENKTELEQQTQDARLDSNSLEHDLF